MWKLDKSVLLCFQTNLHHAKSEGAPWSHWEGTFWLHPDRRALNSFVIESNRLRDEILLLLTPALGKDFCISERCSSTAYWISGHGRALSKRLLFRFSPCLARCNFDLRAGLPVILQNYPNYNLISLLSAKPADTLVSVEYAVPWPRFPQPPAAIQGVALGFGHLQVSLWEMDLFRIYFLKVTS